MNRPGRILVVEDQYFVAIDCEMQLQMAGFECVGLAASAEEAIQLAEDTHPDLALMDIRLASEKDGVEAAMHLFRELGIRSIFTSAHADKVVRESARDAQPLGWLDKPYSQVQLVKAVAQGLAEIERTSEGQSSESIPNTPGHPPRNFM